MIVDLEGEVQDSVYIFLGPPAPQEATSVGAQDKDGRLLQVVHTEQIILIMEQIEVSLKQWMQSGSMFWQAQQVTNKSE